MLISNIFYENTFKNQNHFKGYLSLGPLMYVWDQYVISSDVLEYYKELLPIIAAIICMILRDQLIGSNNVISLKRVGHK